MKNKKSNFVLHRFLDSQRKECQMEKNQGLNRQGDILFQKVTSPSSNAKKPMSNNIIAYGEVTGHAHKIYDPPFAELDSLVDENGDIFIKSHNKDITITHDEHDSIILEKGSWWCITRQREYDPVGAMRERQVAD
jgi:hypothetical protein